MTCRALIVSPATLDYVVTRAWTTIRPGGPALFAGSALALSGCSVYSVGPVGLSTIIVPKIEESLGVSRLGYKVSGEGAVFHHTYDERGFRRSRVLSVPQAIDLSFVGHALRSVNPDIVLVSPVYGEEWGALPAYIYHNHVRCLAIDVQGYTRVNPENWVYSVQGRSSLIAHVSDEDSPLREARLLSANTRVVYYTRGPGPLSIVIDGHEETVEGPGELLEDPTGAGDVFTVLALKEVCEGADPVEAAKYSVNETVRLLKVIHGMVESKIKGHIRYLEDSGGV